MLSSYGGKSFFPPELHLYVSLDSYSLHHYHCILIPSILSFLLHFSCSSHICAGVPTARISWAWGSYWDKGSLVFFFLFHWLSEIQGLYLMNWFLPWSIWILFWILLPLLTFNSFIIKCKGDPNWKNVNNKVYYSYFISTKNWGITAAITFYQDNKRFRIIFSCSSFKIHFLNTQKSQFYESRNIFSSLLKSLCQKWLSLRHCIRLMSENLTYLIGTQ